MAEIKFCGLTRAEDAAHAAVLGAAYAGVIFARGPRLLDVPRAQEVFLPLRGTPVRRVGVFGAQPPEEILRVADATALHVIQLHDGASEAAVRALRQGFAGALWTVLGIEDGVFPAEAVETGAQFDAIVLDTARDGRSGGTGVTFDWEGVAPALGALRAVSELVLAGGLRPSNVARGVELLSPDVVDVSSGVESAPGIKDPEQMRAFVAAVRAAAGPREE